MGGVDCFKFVNCDSFALMNKRKLFVFVAFFTASLLFSYIFISHRHKLQSFFKNDISEKYRLKFKNFGFYPVNDKGVYSFWNVCIESLRVPVTREFKAFDRTLYYNETQRIVVYDSFYREGEQRLHTSGSSNSFSNSWDLTFKRRSIPPGHSFQPVTAFFMVPTCPANIHHFWTDEFVPLYCVIKQGNRLKPGSNNRLIYKQPLDLTKELIKDCTNKTVFEPLLKSLYIKFPHRAFFRMPQNSCFSSGVFGATAATLSGPREIVEHVLRSFFGESRRKGAASNCTVLFMDRSTRKILNVDKLVETAKLLGLGSVCRLAFEVLSVEQQLYAASHAKVMIGVQGAGLQWAVFMPPGSHLVEIAWPQKHWGFYFHNYVNPYGVSHHRIVAPHVRPNWTTYENEVRGGGRVEMEERLQILKDAHVRSSFDHFWKWADVIVDENDLVDVMESLAVDL